MKATSRVVEPPRLEYKGFKYKFNLKGDIVRLLFVRSVLTTIKLDKTCLKFKLNSSFIVVKKSQPKSKYINGPVPTTLKRKRLSSLFKAVL